MLHRFAFASPLGWLELESDGEAVTALRFLNAAKKSRPPAADAPPVLRQAHAELLGYFGKALTRFAVPLHPRGTSFQHRVWQVLAGVPFGQTVTYGQVAAELGEPQASRAVGAACGANPVPILVPCHRVVGASGTLTGYAGGLEHKRWLLEFEGALLRF